MTENEVVEGEIVETPDTPEARTPARIEGGLPYFEQYLMLAERISRTEMVPTNLRGKPDAILAVVMYGAELGIGPMQALQQINFIAGKPSTSAELQRALVLEAGHQFIVTSTREVATAKCKRKDWEEWETTTFSMDDALIANLLAKSDTGWKKYPDQMLAARVTSKACRMWFADVISGMSYTPEEVLSFTEPSPRDTSRDYPLQNEGQPAFSLRTICDEVEKMNDAEKQIFQAKWFAEGLPSLRASWTAEQVQVGMRIVLETLEETEVAQ